MGDPNHQARAPSSNSDSHGMTVVGAVTEGIGRRQCVERLREAMLIHSEGLLHIFKPDHFFRSVIFF